MKLVTAVIKPLRLEEVCDALADIGVVGITVLEVKGYGRQRGHAEIYRGSDYAVNFLPKVKIEVAVTDDMADQVVETIIAAAQTGRVGDGKIFVLDLGQVVRIRTRETDAAAI
jgi:nitrogen regulatory protein PII